jgi:hypothetical protein
MRYLAELAWVPQALRANPGLDWVELGPAGAEAATTTPGGRAAVRLHLAQSGDVVGASAADRPGLVDGRALPTPWRGAFWDHGPLGGLRVPRRAEAGWDLPAGSFTYWAAELTALEVVR